MRPRLLLVGVVAVLALTACAPSLPGPWGANPIEDAIEQETGGQVDLGGHATVPADWPAELPLPAGDLLAAVAVDGSHSLTYRVADEGVGERLVAQLVALGFAELAAADYGELVSHSLERDGWTVVVGWLVADDAVTLTYHSGAH